MDCACGGIINDSNGRLFCSNCGMEYAQPESHTAPVLNPPETPDVSTPIKPQPSFGGNLLRQKIQAAVMSSKSCLLLQILVRIKEARK
jgi:hypothetical protein